MAQQKLNKKPVSNSGSGHQDMVSNPGDNNLDKVRDLLFGTAIRESNDNLQSLEKRFEQKMTKLEKDIQAKLDSVSTLLQKTSEQLNAAITSESSERKADVNELLVKVSETNQAVTDLDGQLMLENKQMSEQFDNELEQLRSNFDKLHQEAMSHLDASAKTLDNDKTDREFLAGLLTDLSDRLQKGQ